MKKRVIFFYLILLASFQISNAQKAFDQLKYEDLELLDGSILKKEDYKDKIVVINIWGTWCNACLTEIPELNELVAKYKDEDIVFLAWSTSRFDSKDKIDAYFEYTKSSFDFLILKPAEKNNFCEMYGRKVSFPSTFVFDREGKHIKTFKGNVMTKNKLNKLNNVIDGLLQEQ